MASIDKIQTKSGFHHQVRYRAPDGTAKKKNFPRLDDARRFRTQIERELQSGSWVDPAKGKIPLQKWLETFLERQHRPLAESTKALYRDHARLYILPSLGRRPLRSITKADVRRVFDDMTAKGKGPSVIEVTYRLLSALLQEAVDEDLIPVNPARGVKKKLGLSGTTERVDDKRIEQIATALPQLLEAVPDRDRALVLTLAYAGLRIGEASFLRVRHVDLFRRRIYVEGAASEVRGKRIEGPTKTRATREVALPAFLVEELKQHVAKYSQPGDPDAYVFSGRDGAPIRSGNWRKRVWHPACAAVGLTPPPHVHWLRHLAASFAILADAHPAVVSARLGHSSTQVTMSVYAHLFDKQQEQLADRLDSMFEAAR